MTDEQNLDDDVETHAIRNGRGPAEPAETEAHAVRSPRRNDETGPDEGTERASALDGDVEGHGIRGKA